MGSMEKIAEFELPCDGCGYDLRAQPRDGQCPECGVPVAESISLAAIPRRPAWRDSDPRWRRRMLAGVWLLVLMPGLNLVQQMLQSAANVPLPRIIDYRGGLTLGQTFFWEMQIYPQAIFCMGVVLLFSKERGRRASRLDWTRRWGILCSYVVALLCAAPILFISSLVMVGISALLLSMPSKYQPGVTGLITEVSQVWLRYGPRPTNFAYFALIAFTSIAILLACVPIFNALCSCGKKPLGAAMVATLALFAALQVAQAGCYAAGIADVPRDLYTAYWYFRPEMLVLPIAYLVGGSGASAMASIGFAIEAVKWSIMLTIAMCLSIAQVAAHLSATIKKV